MSPWQRQQLMLRPVGEGVSSSEAFERMLPLPPREMYLRLIATGVADGSLWSVSQRGTEKEPNE